MSERYAYDKNNNLETRQIAVLLTNYRYIFNVRRRIRFITQNYK